MQWKPIEPLEKVLEGSDPYFHWRRGVGAAGGHDDVGRPVVLRLKDGATARDLEKWGEEAGAGKPLARVPAFYTHPRPELEGAQWCTGLADRQFFDRLTTDDELSSLISRIAVLPPIVPQLDGYEAAIEEDSDPPFNYPESETVVIGIIDYGIAFAHERFRRSKLKSRIEYMWVQDAPSAEEVTGQRREMDEAPARYEASASLEGQAIVNPVRYGREITAGNINLMLQDSARGEHVDEDTLYREAAGPLGRRWLRSVSRRVAHGTHVMDLACGYDLDEDERNQRPIVCVQLPEATTADTSGENLDTYALDGIRYILERADEVARRLEDRKHLPVVINFSYGNVAGPHDGTSDLELAIDELIRLRREAGAPLEVVLPSGNSHLGRLHARIAFENRDESVDLRWRVLPDDRTPSFLEIWLPGKPPSNGQPRIELRVTAPGGSTSDPLDDTEPGAGMQLCSPDGVLCEMRYRHINDPTDRGMFLIALQPTRQSEHRAPVAPSGVWTVTLVNKQLTEKQPVEAVEAWIQRDDTPYGFPRRGRQSYFDHPDYLRFDTQGREIEEDLHPAQAASPSLVQRAGSMNAIATGRNTIVVGGYLRKEMRPASYSAGGPISPAAAPATGAAGASGAKSGSPPRTGPDVLAVSDDSIVQRGVLAAGTRSGSVVALNGTSVAAPQVTRLMAAKLGEAYRYSAPNSGLGKADPRAASDGRQAIAGHRNVRPPPPTPRRPGKERIGAGFMEPVRKGRLRKRADRTWRS